MSQDTMSDVTAIFPNRCTRCHLWTATMARIEPKRCVLTCSLCQGETYVRGTRSRSLELIAKLRRFADIVEAEQSELARLKTHGTHVAYRPGRSTPV